MYETFDDATGQVLLAIESDDLTRRLAQRLHLPRETIRPRDRSAL